jgi:hypothetical protein
MLTSALRGAIAGAAAVWLMDLVTTRCLIARTRRHATGESGVGRTSQPALSNLVDRLDDQTGTDSARSSATSLVPILHYALGVVPGAIYGRFAHAPVVSSDKTVPSMALRCGPSMTNT